MLYLLFLGEMALLYILSRSVNERLFLFFLLISGSRMVAITIITLLFFPGTVIHELSHLFVAEVLGVHTGKLSLIPKEIEKEYIQAGSVEIAKTDPFRRTVIGLAPLFVGTIVITLLSIQLTTIGFPTNNTSQFTTIIFFFLSYLLLSISNNMFSSKEDLIGVPPVLIFLGLLLGTSYVVGVRIELTGNMLKTLEYVVKTINYNIGIILLINAGMLLFLWGLIWGVKKIK